MKNNPKSQMLPLKTMKTKELIKNGCYGCFGCFNICPKSCISMSENSKGFYTPSIDESQCVNCRKCINTCIKQMKIDTDGNNFNVKAYYGHIKSNAIVMKSSSGGIFTALANQIISENGVVYGAIYDKENIRIVHVPAYDEVNISLQRKSKYVQSYIGFSFKEVIEILKENKKVLFTGTPCQIAALKLITKDCNKENLLTCDFICHGVPSPKLFRDHIISIKKNRNSNPTVVDFRYKGIGWKSKEILVKLSDTSFYRNSAEIDPYFRGFHKNITLSEKCYQCKFATGVHLSDITIADFWRVNELKLDNNNDKGVSLVITNSLKGRSHIERIQPFTNLQEINFEKIIYCLKPRNPEIYNYEKHEQFFREYLAYGYNFVRKRYLCNHGLNSLYKKIKYFIRRFGILIIKREYQENVYQETIK